ncbi:3-deoxy-7-phosphoheptulonate synthase [Kangiella sediminilitoris]|uniref:Phospho-2-dehydro-3-deoxyheptonate aldolase n=1 Tax=Kangiella sediminilitoris TaxID=1144748 RepID=A0A1B3B8S1_9GAMM|nr:3-deoxy-7-phosphoheptulonate synthase class II [Kangiella sediminilitoris]AOE49192.1 phospho-2-dehydro-3-deoxyheptonate aldolase [Kangiella sediminilitoris]
MVKSGADNWTPDSWKSKPVSQQIKYGDPTALAQVTEKLCQLPPLVSSSEVDTLKNRIAEAQRGERFILQGGDCAESFKDCNAEAISQKVRSLLSLSLLVSQKLRMPVSRIGRIAGQYAKPRSALTETQGDTTLTSYRGDLVNHVHFSESARTPDPARMLEGYSYASLTLNYIRSLLEGELEELFNLEPEVASLKDLAKTKELHQSLRNFRDALQLFHQFNGRQAAHKNLTEFYTSHEALHLHYEQALTRLGSNGRWYNLSTHFPWVGMRTVQSESAHLEYLRGIANPIAIKVGPTVEAKELVKLCRWLNPENEEGRLTLIQRFGHDKISHKLPELIRAVKDADLKVLWSCDPMHGNTQVSSNNYKTRDFQHIQSELQQAFSIHADLGSHLGAAHLEMTGEAVMECIGSSYAVHHQELGEAYTSLVDPRLNLSQAFELIDSLSLKKAQPAARKKQSS